MTRGPYRERFAITITIAAPRRFMTRGTQPKKRGVTGAPKGWINNDGIGGGDGGFGKRKLFICIHLATILADLFVPTRHPTYTFLRGQDLPIFCQNRRILVDSFPHLESRFDRTGAHELCPGSLPPRSILRPSRTPLLEAKRRRGTTGR